MTAYLGLGSNLGDRFDNLRRAVRRLDAQTDITVTGISPIYETLPFGGPDQPDFFNAAVEIETVLDPSSLLRTCCAIETDMGRERNVRWGPRTIDIDILLYDRLILAGEELTIPHPLMQVRAFVMYPLADIAPDMVHPVIGKTAAEIRDGLGPEGARRRDDLNLAG